MENKSAAPVAQVLVPAVSEIRSLLEASRKNVAQQVNQELLSTYWKIGEVVVRCEQNDSIRAAYGEKTLSQLSRALTKELGKGFSRSNVYNMRQFYLSYPIFQTVSGKLNWSHYCELLSISDKEKRSFYEKETVNAGWSVREMKRQIDSSLFERLLLSRGDANKEQVLALAEKGVDYAKPEDIIKDPYVFEFLGLPEEKPFLESDLEAALVRLTLETGRTHQIRVHMADAGHPLIGDRLYFADTDQKADVDAENCFAGIKRAALHASRICFYQPFEGKRITVEAPFPEDMKKCLFRDE